MTNNKKRNVLVTYRFPDTTDLTTDIDNELFIQQEIAKLMHKLVSDGIISHFVIADEIAKEIKERGQIQVPDGCVTGEEFEKWLREKNTNLTPKEIDKFFDNTVFVDDPKCRQAMIHGMRIAAMLTSDCNPMVVNFVSTKDGGNDDE